MLGLVFVVAGLRRRAAFWSSASASRSAACVAHWRRSNRALQAALFGVALFATLIPEFVALQGDVGPHEHGLQVLPAGLGAAVDHRRRRARLAGARRRSRDRLLRQVRPAWIALLVIFVLAAVAYPLLASKGKIGLRFTDMPLSLDGMQYMDSAQYLDDGKDLNLPADAQAIRWMQDNVVGHAGGARRPLAGVSLGLAHLDLHRSADRSWAGTSTRASSAPATRA